MKNQLLLALFVAFAMTSCKKDSATHVKKTSALAKLSKNLVKFPVKLSAAPVNGWNPYWMVFDSTGKEVIRTNYFHDFNEDPSKFRNWGWKYGKTFNENDTTRYPIGNINCLIDSLPAGTYRVVAGSGGNINGNNEEFIQPPYEQPLSKAGISSRCGLDCWDFGKFYLSEFDLVVKAPTTRKVQLDLKVGFIKLVSPTKVISQVSVYGDITSYRLDPKAARTTFPYEADREFSVLNTGKEITLIIWVSGADEALTIKTSVEVGETKEIII